MTRKTVSDAVSGIHTRYIEEAADYSARKRSRGPVGRKLGMLAACLCLMIGICRFFALDQAVLVTAHAYGTEEEITETGVVMSTGKISDSGELTGHPLMFFLSGEGIGSVRFSCKNQMINFMDWTEKRDEYGNGQNFTVPYGEDESEYYFLLIDWVPVSTIRALTDQPGSAISTLPAELREDMIVMEITFANGKTATKAIHVSLREDGTFFAAFGDYTIREEDSFVNRPDSKAVPREVLYGETELTVTFYDKEQNEVPAEALWYNLRDVDNILVEWTTATPDTVRLFYTPAGTETGEQTRLLMTKAPMDGDSKIVLSLSELEKAELYGHFQIELAFGERKMTRDYNVFYDPDYEAHSALPVQEDPVDAIFSASEAYFEDKGFTVEEEALLEHTWTDAVTELLVSKDGVIEETARRLTLALHEDTWEVVEEEQTSGLPGQ